MARTSDLIEVPRGEILVAARSTVVKGTGYGAEGEAENTFKPSSITREEYKSRPGTPYDLVLPIRMEHLEWYVDDGVAEVVRIGEKGLLEQVMFSEGSRRGEVTLRVLNRGPRRRLLSIHPPFGPADTWR